jgi:hypothetical protein
MPRGRKFIFKAPRDADNYRIFVAADDLVYIEFDQPGPHVFAPDDAFDFAQGVLRGYDIATGIAALRSIT